MSAAASSPSAEKEKKFAKQSWLKLMNSALDADTWGQTIEASEQYEKLNSLLEQQIPSLPLSYEERSQLLKIRHCVALRMQLLKAQDADEDDAPVEKPSQELKLDEMKLVGKVLEDLFSRPIGDFPLTLHEYTAALDPKKKEQKEQVIVADEKGTDAAENGGATANSASTGSTKDEVTAETKAGGTLKPPPKAKSGQTTVSFIIEKIGLKDAETYLAPQISVVLSDTSGSVLEQQDTPASKDQKPLAVVFGETVHVQSPLEDLKDRSASVFFEFKHYKPKKKKVSTRCYAVMEFDEIVRAAGQQSVCLELYKKPVDYAKKKFSLFTVKKLYLHVGVVLTKH